MWNSYQVFNARGTTNHLTPQSLNMTVPLEQTDLSVAKLMLDNNKNFSKTVIFANLSVLGRNSNKILELRKKFVCKEKYAVKLWEVAFT